MPSWLTASLAAAIAGLGAILLWRWRRHRRGAAVSVLTVHGAARCRAALELLHRLAGADQHEIAAAWEAIELPLLQALPDCPPAWKPALAEAIEGCAARVAKRELAKRLMTMRNALL